MADKIYRVQGPDGRVIKIRGPEGASDDDLFSAAEDHLATLKKDQAFNQSVQSSPGEALRDDLTSSGLKVGTVGAGAASAAGLGWLFRRAFPGVNPSRSFLRELDNSLKQDFGKGVSVKTEFPQYMREVVQSGKPLTFGDYLASRSGAAQGETFAPNTLGAINKALNHSGKGADVRSNLVKRITGTQDRVLNDLAGELGVPQKTLAMTQDELEKKAKATAQPLYEKAFADKNPMLNGPILALLQKHEPLMEAALNHADEAFKFDPTKQVESRTGQALAGKRKDRWKYPIEASEIPGFMQLGEPKNGLQRYISPNLETFDRMKRALWSLAEKRGKEGAGDVGAIHGARRELTDLLDQWGPPEYKQARTAWRGSEEMQDAFEMGSGLLKQNPADVRQALVSMTQEQRLNLARGFYGALEDQNTQKFIREIVANPEKYSREREILSAVFPDTSKLDSFLNKLGGESAMTAGSVAYRRGDPLAPSGGIFKGLASRLYGGFGGPHMYLREHFPLSTEHALNNPKVGARGSSIMFDEPQPGLTGTSHPWWKTIDDHKTIYPGDYGWMGAGALGGVAANQAMEHHPAPTTDPESIEGAGALSQVSPYMP